ncbi:DNA/RNA non-specific endonuclease [Nocardioides sp. NPDC057772]|uniref:DNA/RNA non-specific endonuclease n=1 Tax=Nocardioides sp. NPDC057772 TaxID=3346245 RepID=UPI00366DE517
MKAARAPLRDPAGRRWFGRLLALATLLLALLTALPATAIDVPFDPLPIPGEDACNNLDAPIPASPHGFGSFVVKLDVDRAGRSADPFAAKHPASIESVYGTSPQWFTYDNGCTGQFVADAGTALSNILLEVAGLLPNWSHALLHSVLSPSSWLIALEEPVVEATTATTQGVWSPWLPIVLLLVVVIIILRSRAGRFAASATAAAWALLVLGLSSWLMNYPLEAVHLVDDGVRGATELIATSFNDNKAVPQDAKDLGDESAVVAVDVQFDHIVRTTQYRTWVTGVFGNPDSATAKEYGPKVFAATHFSWKEYETYRDDPEGAGAKIVEQKADDFKTYAEQIKENDALAYDHFKGGHWSQRATTSLVNLAMILVTCGFLLLAALATLLAYALVRLLVPFSPALGVLFMIDRTRDAAVAMLKRVAGPLVMGPICFLVGLLLLRFFAAILTTDALWFVLKLGLIAVLTYVAWKLVRPQAYTVGPVLNRAFAPLKAALAARVGAAHGAGRQPANVTEAAPTYSGGQSANFALPYLPPPGATWTDPDAANFVPYVPAPKAPEPTSSAADEQVARSTGTPTVSQKPSQYDWPIGPHPQVRASELYPAPPVRRTAAIMPLGPRTRFPPDGLELEPNTAYQVAGRGTYYTDDEGMVTHVETEFGTKGNLNWDLNYPAANVTYVVSDRFRYDTDAGTRTVRASDVQARRGDAPRSPSIQSSVGRAAGDGYDGGHLHQNAHAGGAERINIVAMLQELNRSGSQDYGSIPNSFYRLETELRAMVDTGRNVEIDLYIDYPEDSDSRTPTAITAEYRIDGGDPIREEFENVRDD